MTERYVLYYWPIPFRGHPIRFILAQVGAGWSEVDHDTILALKDAAPEAHPYPFMAPPLLFDRDTGRWLSQMPAIVMALGRAHGLTRDADLELRLACDASDILLEITRGHGAQMWDAPTWAAFRDHRLPRWMRLHECLVPEAGMDARGLAPLILAGLWHTMTDRLPPLRPMLDAEAPMLAALIDEVAARPAIAGLRAVWAGSQPVYCAGQIEASLLSVLGMT
jgi:glutathione S-transferase